MQTLTTFVAALLLASTPVTNAENCNTKAIYDKLQPVTSEPNFAACQTESNYTLLSLATPSLVQTRGFCASPACLALLSATVVSGLLPDCDVAVGERSFKLTDAVTTVTSKCTKMATVRLSLDERAVDKSDIHSKAQSTSGHVATILGHSAPMDEVGGVGELAGALLSLLSLLSLLRQ